jgi:hypothetical protein
MRYFTFRQVVDFTRININLVNAVGLMCSSETSVDFQRITWRYMPEDSTLSIS